MNGPSGSWLSAVRTATGGLLRHKVQAVVLGMVLLVSTASATLGLTLLAASNGPFQHAFNAQDGAHLSLTVNPAHAGAAQLAATRTLPRGHGAGRAVRPGDGPGAMGRPALRAAHARRAVLGGRPGGRRGAERRALADRAGPDRPGRHSGGRRPGGRQQDRRHRVAAAPVTLTVVGFANSITYTADGWVAPAEIVCSAGAGRAGRARSCCTGSPARAPRPRSAPTWRKSQGHSRRAR